MTIKHFIEFFKEQLAGLEWYDAREVKAMATRLLEEIAGLPSYKVLVEPQKELDSVVEGRLRELTGELATGRPLQYVLGYEMFCGHKFNVSEGVLIPRPETEELVRLVTEDIRLKRTGLRVLDICSGSGCITWSVAAAMLNRTSESIGTKSFYENTVWGCDISDIALSIASGQKIESRVIPQFFKCDILDGNAYNVISRQINKCCADSQNLSAVSLPEEFKLDIIISNPPYVCEEEKLQMRANVLDFEPYCALFVPNNNPLLFYNIIAQLSGKLLKKGGKIYFEVNERFAKQTAQILAEYGFKECRVVDDLFGKPRFVTANKAF